MPPRPVTTSMTMSVCFQASYCEPLQAEVLRLDESGRIGDGAGDQAREAFGQVASGGRHVKRRSQIPVFVKNRRGRAEQARVASEEVLIAIDRHRALVDDAGADAVGAFVLLAPDAANPKAGAVEHVVVGRGAPAIHDDPARVIQDDRAADAAYREKEAIDAALRGEEQGSHPFARLRDLVLGQALRGRAARRIECVQCAGPTRGRGERRACGVVAGNHLENMICVGGALDLPHPILPAVPPAATALSGHPAVRSDQT